MSDPTDKRDAAERERRMEEHEREAQRREGAERSPDAGGDGDQETPAPPGQAELPRG